VTVHEYCPDGDLAKYVEKTKLKNIDQSKLEQVMKGKKIEKTG
jgi:hypothetical protein